MFFPSFPLVFLRKKKSSLLLLPLRDSDVGHFCPTSVWVVPGVSVWFRGFDLAGLDQPDLFREIRPPVDGSPFGHREVDVDEMEVVELLDPASDCSWVVFKLFGDIVVPVSASPVTFQPDVGEEVFEIIVKDFAVELPNPFRHWFSFFASVLHGLDSCVYGRDFTQVKAPTKSNCRMSA